MNNIKIPEQHSQYLHYHQYYCFCLLLLKMSYSESYLPLLRVYPEEYLYTLPNLCSVPPELEVPELVIPATKPGSRDPYTRTMPSTKMCKRDRTSPYTLPQREHSSATHWRQDITKQGIEVVTETTTKKQLKRKRTVFSADELEILITYYKQNKFLNPDSKAEILSKIDVPANVLVMWFQNKRAKDRATGMVI